MSADCMNAAIAILSHTHSHSPMWLLFCARPTALSSEDGLIPLLPSADGPVVTVTAVGMSFLLQLGPLRIPEELPLSSSPPNRPAI